MDIQFSNCKVRGRRLCVGQQRCPSDGISVDELNHLFPFFVYELRGSSIVHSALQCTIFLLLIMTVLLIDYGMLSAIINTLNTDAAPLKQLLIIEHLTMIKLLRLLGYNSGVLEEIWIIN